MAQELQEFVRNKVRVETMRNVRLVSNMTELLSQPSSNLFDGIVYYVTDIKQNFALINNFPYKLIQERISGETKYYFEVPIFNGSISVGGYLYTGTVVVSSKYGDQKKYNLGLYKNGSVIRIYYKGGQYNTFDIIPTNNLINLPQIDYSHKYNTSNHSIISIDTGTIVSSGLISVEEGKTYYLQGDGIYNLDISEIEGGFFNSDSSLVSVADVVLGTDFSGSDLKCFTVPKGEGIQYVVINLVSDSDREYIVGDILLSEYIDNDTKVFMNGVYEDSDSDNSDPSHYFRLKYVSNKDKIGPDCWEKLKKTSLDYRILNNIIDKTDGNNPHNGKLKYDNGMEYLNRFNRLFKYASENRLFNETCFYNVNQAYSEIDEFGFSCSAFTDSKVHAFVDSVDENGVETPYDITNKESLSKMEWYDRISEIDKVDGVTSQIINTKYIDLIFYLGIDESNIVTKESQEKIKYFQCKVMPYIEQMLPSTVILNVRFAPYNSKTGRIFDYTFNPSFN